MTESNEGLPCVRIFRQKICGEFVLETTDLLSIGQSGKEALQNLKKIIKLSEKVK